MPAPASAVNAAQTPPAAAQGQDNARGRMGAHTVTDETGQNDRDDCAAFVLPCFGLLGGLIMVAHFALLDDSEFCYCSSFDCDTSDATGRDTGLQMGTGVTIAASIIIVGNIMIRTIQARLVPN